MTVLPDDYARCQGATYTWLTPLGKAAKGTHPLCVDCLRRTAPMRDQPYWFMAPPKFTTTCPERIAP